MTPSHSHNQRLINGIIFALPLVIVLPLVFQYGVFFDGALYAAYARNLSEGIGSFWGVLTWPGGTPIREQPPLAFFLESFFFKALGNKPYVEGLYGFTCLYLTSLGMTFLQRRISRAIAKPCDCAKEKFIAWPVLLYFALPIVLWTSRNNMIENTLTVATTWAAYFGVAAVFCTSRTHQAIHIMAFTAALLAAFFTKGPVGLFPLAVPFFCVLLLSEWRNQLFASFVKATLPILAFFASFALLWLLPDVRAFVRDFFMQQVLPSSMSQRESSGSHFTIVAALVSNIAIPVFALSVLAFILKTLRTDFRNVTTAYKTALLWLLVFISAWMPFLISTKQMPWYLVPSLPFFALALADTARQTFQKVEAWLFTKKKLLIATLAVLLLSAPILASYKSGSVYKNHNFYNSFLPLQHTLPTRTQYGVCDAELIRHWHLVTPLLRYFQSVVLHNSSPRGIWIIQNQSPKCFSQSNCQILNSPESFFQVYSCSGANP